MAAKRPAACWIMSRWRKGLSGWLLRRLPRQHELVLGQSRIYLLPTPFGWTLLLVALAVWLGALNYAVSLAYVLAFWIVSLMLVAVWQAYRQLAGLAVHCAAVPPVFAGSVATFPLQLSWSSPEARRLQAGWLNEEALPVVTQSGELALPLPAVRRGQLAMPPLQIFSEAPFGLIRAFAYVRLQAEACVYPQPLPDEQPARYLPAAAGQHGRMQAGGELFSHLASWRPEQGVRRIAWKVYARQGKLVARQFAEPAAAHGTRLLDWAMFPDAMAVEERLSRLCWQLLEVGRSGDACLLRLPQQELMLAAAEVVPGLRALSLFGVRDAS